MLQYMGRENLEDYNAVFLIQLESWEAALKSGFAPLHSGNRPQQVEIARLLGWLEFHGSAKTPQLNKPREHVTRHMARFRRARIHAPISKASVSGPSP
jgi:hypothetical protein